MVTFVGYAINMLAVPVLALAGNWPLAGALIIAERTGRANPPACNGSDAVSRRRSHWAGLGIWLQ